MLLDLTKEIRDAEKIGSRHRAHDSSRVLAASVRLDAVHGSALYAAVLGRVGPADDKRHRRDHQRHVRRRAPRCHHRSLEPRTHRKGSHRREQRRRAVQHRRSAPGHVCRHDHPPRFPNGQARGHRAGGGLHRDRERGAPGRRPGGDDHGQRRNAARRHAERPEADGAFDGPARHAADEHQERERGRDDHAWVRDQPEHRGRRRLHDAGRWRHLSRQGWQQYHVRRNGDSTCGRQHGLHTQHGPCGRSDAVDERHLGREQCRWVRDEHGPQGRRQHVPRKRLRPVQRQQVADEQPDRRTARPRPHDDQRSREGLGCHVHPRRADQAGQDLVPGAVPRMGHGGSGRGQVLEPDPGHDVLHAGS